ncbi:MAG: GNAT family N-acetyltransferase [Ferruginibacter sp.]
MSKYRVEQIGADKFDLLIPLMKDCFSMEVDINYFHWKYIQNPAGSFLGFIAIENETGEVGAYYGVIPQKFIIAGNEQVIYQSCDTMTHSRHRRQGLFKMLAMECYEHLRKEEKLFIIGFGGADSTPGFLKFGWKHIFNFRYYFKPAFFCKFYFFRRVPLDGFIEEDIDLNLGNLLERPHTSEHIHSARTKEHILWRSKNINYNYQFVFHRSKGVIQGYALYYIQDKKMILFDFLYNDKKAGKALTWFLSRKVAKEHYRGVIAYCQQNGEQAKQLKEMGFFSNPFNRGPLRERTPFIFYSTTELMNKYADPEQWQITSYDHDAL